MNLSSISRVLSLFTRPELGTMTEQPLTRTVTGLVLVAALAMTGVACAGDHEDAIDSADTAEDELVATPAIRFGQGAEAPIVLAPNLPAISFDGNRIALVESDGDNLSGELMLYRFQGFGLGEHEGLVAEGRNLQSDLPLIRIEQESDGVIVAEKLSANLTKANDYLRQFDDGRWVKLNMKQATANVVEFPVRHARVLFHHDKRATSVELQRRSNENAAWTTALTYELDRTEWSNPARPGCTIEPALKEAGFAPKRKGLLVRVAFSGNGDDSCFPERDEIHYAFRTP